MLCLFLAALKRVAILRERDHHDIKDTFVSLIDSLSTAFFVLLKKRVKDEEEDNFIDKDRRSKERGTRSHY